MFLINIADRAGPILSTLILRLKKIKKQTYTHTQDRYPGNSPVFL